jgi:probable F420-dependent oxidoreductase
MRIGYVLPNSWGLPDPRDDIALAVRAEQLGATSLWVSHHVVHAGFIGERLGTGNYYDPLISLTAAAMATSTARLGTSVLVLGYLNPLVLAKQLATIDWLSRGRLDAGVGVGGLRDEFAALNQAPFERRGRYADECIDVIRMLWSAGRHSYSGEFFTIEDTEAYPGPYKAEGIPILVGGSTPGAVRRLVERGDGWHGIGLTPDQATAERTTIADALTAVGRTIDAMVFQLRLHVDADDLDVPAWQTRWRAYAAAGVTDLVLSPQSRSYDDHIRWLETLLPALASLE